MPRGRCVGYMEYGFMSTTSSKETALQYSGVRKAGTKPTASSPPPPPPPPRPEHTQAFAFVLPLSNRPKGVAPPVPSSLTTQVTRTSWLRSAASAREPQIGEGAAGAEATSLPSPPCTASRAYRCSRLACLLVSGGWWEGYPGQVLMAKVTSVDRGACIRDLSQYPGEVRRGMREHMHTQDARMYA